MTREELNEEIQKEIEKEQNKETIKKVIKVVLKWTVILTVFFTLFFAYTTYISTVKVGVREYRIKNKKIPDTSCIKDLREARAGFEPAVKVLQTSALPLGYHAIYHKGGPTAVGRFLMISK